MHQPLKAADALVQLSRDEEGKARRSNARPRRNRAILALLYDTGLRVSEQVQLTLEQYQGNHLVNVRRKGKVRTRRIYLPAECRRLVDDYLNSERRDDAPPQGSAAPLFVSTHDDARSPDGFCGAQQVNRLLQQIAQMASAQRLEVGFQLHPHRLLHTCGDRHREKSGSDTETAAALGHISLRYVVRYVRKTEEERDALIDTIFDCGKS